MKSCICWWHSMCVYRMLKYVCHHHCRENGEIWHASSFVARKWIECDGVYILYTQIYICKKPTQLLRWWEPHAYLLRQIPIHHHIIRAIREELSARASTSTGKSATLSVFACSGVRVCVMRVCDDDWDVGKVAKNVAPSQPERVNGSLSKQIMSVRLTHEKGNLHSAKRRNGWHSSATLFAYLPCDWKCRNCMHAVYGWWRRVR